MKLPIGHHWILEEKKRRRSFRQEEIRVYSCKRCKQQIGLFNGKCSDGGLKSCEEAMVQEIMRL